MYPLDIEMFTTSKKNSIRPAFKVKKGRLSGKVFHVAKDDIDPESGFKDLTVMDGMIQHIPGYKDRECLYITGPSGSGKSTYCSQYAREYKKKHPKNNLVLISPISDDDCLSKLNPIRVTPNEENFINDPITLEEVRDSLVIFDDVDAIHDKKVKEAVMNFRSQILLTGRHYCTSVLTTSHMICDYKATREQINESHFVTFYPSGGANYHIKRFLKEYCGLKPAEITKILKLPSRWVTVHKNYPMYVLSKDSVYML
jgi:energy-coupling factor transporter ATP-binding protein EcfA2